MKRGHDKVVSQSLILESGIEASVFVLHKTGDNVDRIVVNIVGMNDEMITMHLSDFLLLAKTINNFSSIWSASQILDIS